MPGVARRRLVRLKRLHAQVEYQTTQRLAVIDKYEDIPTIEREIGAGQIEQVIQKTKEQLDVLPLLAEARIWEHGETSKERCVCLRVRTRVGVCVFVCVCVCACMLLTRKRFLVVAPQ